MAAVSRRAWLCRRWLRKLLPELRAIAWDHGYALAVHGTVRRDIDLVAVPWIEHAASEGALMRALVAEVGRYTEARVRRVDEARDYCRLERPHGRVGYAVHLTWDFGAGPYLDISVMPRAPRRVKRFAG